MGNEWSMNGKRMGNEWKTNGKQIKNERLPIAITAEVR